MSYEYTSYALPLVLAAVLAFPLVLYSRRFRGTSGSTEFAAVMAAGGVWAASGVMELAGADEPTKLFWASVQYFGIVAIPPSWLCFALQFAGRGPLPRTVLPLLMIEPLAILVAVWTNSTHGLIWSSISVSDISPVLILEHGPGFWINIGYSYLLITVASFILLQTTLRVRRLYLRQAGVLLAATVAPWVGNVLYISGAGPITGLDLTPVFFGLAGLILVLGLFRFRLLDLFLGLADIARDPIVDAMSDGFIVVDNKNRIIDSNQSGQALIGQPVSEVIGRPIGELLPQLAQIVSLDEDDAKRERAEVSIGNGAMASENDLLVSPVRNRRGDTVGKLLVFRDITERKRAEDALRESEKRFHSVFSQSFQFMALLEPTGVVLDSNQPALALGKLMSTNPVGRPIWESSPWREEPMAQEKLREGVSRAARGDSARWQARFSGGGGLEYTLDVSVKPMSDESGRVTSLIAEARDMTDYTLAQAALRDSEQRFRRIFEDAPVGMVVIGRDDKLIKVNDALCRMLGYGRSELADLAFSAILHPETRETKMNPNQHLLAVTTVSPKGETRLLTKNGETVWVEISAKAMRPQGGETAYGLAIIEDITDRKRAELLEVEQREVAYELHDGLAQLVAGVHQHLQACAHHYRPRSAQGKKELAEVMDLARAAAREVRRVIDRLRPTALDDFGLAMALRFQVEARRAEGWDITYEENLEGKRLSLNTETALLRVAQEALTNVAKHSNKKTVRVSLITDSQTVRLEVQDWGSGFDVESMGSGSIPGQRVGVRGMRDRVALVGGRFSIDSELGKGTLIVAEVPFEMLDGRDMP